MRAFLSHSSRDKVIVEEVAGHLGADQVELDSQTFDAGLLNTEVIRDSLKRSSIFILFLTRDALASSYVRFEALLAYEFRAKGLLDRFVVVCLDSDAFSQASENWKDYSFVRHLNSAQSIARLIQNYLISHHATLDSINQPHVERSRELNDLKRQLIQPGKPSPRALYISGHSGIGRRTFVRRFYSDRYPKVNLVFAEIQIDLLDGYEEIFRKLCGELAPTWPLSAFRARIVGFSMANDKEKSKQIASLLEQLVDSREAIFIRDGGGLLDNDGALQLPFKCIFSEIRKRDYPTIVFIARRMIPGRQRGDLDIVYCGLPSMTDDQIRELAGFLLIDEKISYTAEDLDSIVSLCDGHPFNVKFLTSKAKEYTLPIALADPSELVHWKVRRGSAFLRDVKFSKEETLILAALRDFNILDFETIQKILQGNLELAAAVLTRLIDLHVVEVRVDSYAVSPPLRTAVQRDRRLEVDGQERQMVLDIVSETLQIRNDGETIALSMIDAGILASLKSSSSVPENFSVFLLPSHQVWHARRYYDEGRWKECAKLAEEALAGANRLSPAGRVEACRLLCLATARLNDQTKFSNGLAKLKAWANDSYARSNMHFCAGLMPVWMVIFRGQKNTLEPHWRKNLGISMRFERWQQYV